MYKLLCRKKLIKKVILSPTSIIIQNEDNTDWNLDRLIEKYYKRKFISLVYLSQEERRY